MTEITRRAFITQSGMVAIGFGALASSSFALRAAETATNERNVLVFILLRGGADGLNICAPYGDAEYYKSRPTLALPKPRAVSRDGTSAAGTRRFTDSASHRKTTIATRRAFSVFRSQQAAAKRMAIG